MIEAPDGSRVDIGLEDAEAGGPVALSPLSGLLVGTGGLGRCGMWL